MTTQAERYAALVRESSSAMKVVDAHDTNIAYAMSLADQLGVLKDSSRGQYLLLTVEGSDDTTVIKLHPQAAMKMLANNGNDQFKLVPVAAPVVEQPAATEPTAPVEATTTAPVASNTTGKGMATVFYAAKKAELEAITGGLDKVKGRCPLRSAVMEYMQKTLGFSDAKASTYYQNLKSGVWKS